MYPTDGRDDVIESGDRGNRPTWWPGWAGQIGGLRATAGTVGTCGALPTGAPTALTLPAGATEWLTVTFHVLVRCPQPLPVQFVVSYTTAGKMSTAQLDEFPDLGQVTYNGCPTAQ